MSTRPHHATALANLVDMIAILPNTARWSLTLTDDDSPKMPAAMNVYVKTEAQRLEVRKLLSLIGLVVVDESTDWETYTPLGALQISCMEAP